MKNVKFVTLTALLSLVMLGQVTAKVIFFADFELNSGNARPNKTLRFTQDDTGCSARLCSDGKTQDFTLNRPKRHIGMGDRRRENGFPVVCISINSAPVISPL